MAAMTVLVTGATGRQGGSVCRHLLKRGHTVRALARDVTAPAASYLEKLGAQLVRGDFDDRLSIERAARGADAVFAVSTPFEAGAEAEARQGRTLADAARRSGVKHLVFSSVASADRHTGLPHFDSKAEVERHIAILGVPWTVIAPVFFMENFVSPPFLTGLRAGRLAMPLPADRKLQMVAVDDVGSFAALVLERREPFLRRRIDIASDELTGAQAARVLSEVSGRAIEYVEVPLEAVRLVNEDFAKLYEWLDRAGYHADLEALRREYPEVGWHRLGDWAKTQELSVLAEPLWLRDDVAQPGDLD